uniref:hypothetical protein n=1 Tax=Phocaeicola coprophilus TaxID=387090 RepID=UPI0027958C84
TFKSRIRRCFQLLIRINNIYIYLQTQSVMRIIARSKVVENYTEHPGETFRTSWVSPSRVSDYLTGRCEQP